MRLPSTLAALFLAATGCAAGPDPATDADTDPVSTGEVTTETELDMQVQLELAPTLNTIEAQASADPAFSHVAIDAATRTVIVYRVGGAPSSLPSWAAAGAAHVEFRAAAFSAADALKLADRISDDSDRLAAAGIRLASWGPDGEGRGFVIGVDGDPVAARAALVASYPELAGKLVVEPAHIVPGARTNDSAPYWGGDRITAYDGLPGSADWVNCSGGIPVKNAGGTYMVTAAHCNCNTGTQWDNLVVGTGTFHNMGTWNRSVDRTWDMAYINARTGNSVFTDTVSNAHHAGGFAFVLSAAHPHVGEHVCVDGSYAKLRCGAKVKGWVYIHLESCAGTHRVAEWYADQINDHALAGYGDSGGGVFVLDTATRSASARGVFSAFNPTLSCPDDANRTCGSRVFFPDIVQAIHKYDFHVNF